MRETSCSTSMNLLLGFLGGKDDERLEKILGRSKKKYVKNNVETEKRKEVHERGRQREQGREGCDCFHHNSK